MAPDHQERLGSRCDCIRQRRVRRFVRQILLAGEKSHECPALLRDVVADRTLQHRIASLQRVEDRALRDRTRRPRAAPRRRPAPASADAPGGPPGSSCQRLNFDRKHGRKIADDRSPAVSGIGRRVHLPARGAEVHAARIERIDRHRVAQHVDVAVALRQTFGERLPLVSAGPAADIRAAFPRAENAPSRS